MNPLNEHASLRTFLGQAGVSVGAALAAPAVAAAAPKARATTRSARPETVAEKYKRPGRGWESLTPTGWNRFAKRFVYAPTLTWNEISGAAAYIVQYAHENDKQAQTVRLEKPVFDMGSCWASIDNGLIDLLAWAVDAEGKPISSTRERRFYKSAGFDGVRLEPADYLASIDRNMAYLLAPPRDEVKDYERGLPRSCWSSTEDSITGGRRFLAFPALHHPSFILGYLEYARQIPGGEHAAEAVRQAKQYGHWLLENRHPADWKCSLFPYSTIEYGRMEGYIEGRNVTLFRAARVGEAMVALFRHFKDERYLAYARHLADVYVKLQGPDGAWPYRIDPKDGKVVEEYTSNAITAARLFGMLEKIEPNPAYAAAREKAAQWMMENPVRDYRWQGMYEDVGAAPPYRNLQHYDTNEMIRYLVHYHRDDRERMRVAEELNRWIEDQFVIWQYGDRSVDVRCPTPMVCEQYTCFDPMEGHTARWMLTLIALHRATGDDTYLTKAANAGNALVRAQQPSGAYSTWGYDLRFQRPLLTLDWPGANANAVFALLQLDRYVKDLPRSRNEEQYL